jgi:ABC-type nickel/cobalt efflux system permease component RcnA
MFGLDDRLASFSDGTTLVVVALVAAALGLRHASDPDHLAAVTTLVASGKERTARAAARLGLAWGLGHAASLFVFGVPIVLYRAYLPPPVQAAAETTVGFVVVVLAAWLLVRWRRGVFSDASHRHDDELPAHAHVHARTRAHAHAGTRSPAQACAIGLVHGMGGSAGVGVLLLAALRSHALALAALAIFALCTALSMALLSTGFGVALEARRVRGALHRLAPALGVASLGFGIWYALGAQGLVPYAF